MEENAAATPTSASTSTFERDDAWKELMGTDIMMKVVGTHNPSDVGKKIKENRTTGSCAD